MKLSMKKAFLFLGGLLLAVQLSASSPAPFTEAVGFSFQLQGTGSAYGGGVGVDITAEAPASSGGTVNGGESPVANALLRPGKQYPMTFSGTIIGTQNVDSGGI